MNVDPNQLLGLAMTLIKAAPAILGWFVIIRLAYDRIKGWKQALSPMDAAYTMASVALFAYAIR